MTGTGPVHGLDWTPCPRIHLPRSGLYCPCLAMHARTLGLCTASAKSWFLGFGPQDPMLPMPTPVHWDQGLMGPCHFCLAPNVRIRSQSPMLPLPSPASGDQALPPSDGFYKWGPWGPCCLAHMQGSHSEARYTLCLALGARIRPCAALYTQSKQGHSPWGWLGTCGEPCTPDNKAPGPDLVLRSWGWPPLV